MGNGNWTTLGYRDLDESRWPAEMHDLSTTRQWLEESTNTQHQLVKPKKLPESLEMPPSFCDAESDMILLLTGTVAVGPTSPQVILKMNRSTEIFHWDLRMSTNMTGHQYVVWAMETRTNKTESVVNLTEWPVDFKTPQTFNLSISCKDYNGTGMGIFKVVLNHWDPSGDPNGLSRSASAWDIDAQMDTTLDPADVTTVEILGTNMELDYVGFTASGCLTVAPNGLVVEMKGTECGQALDAICEHQSCYTIEGDECVFPFDYKTVTYQKCTSQDVYLPWCATGEPRPTPHSLSRERDGDRVMGPLSARLPCNPS